MKRAIVNIMSATSVLLITIGTAMAQGDYPNRPVRIVVAWPPGSGIDVLVRKMTDQLREELGQAMVVDNKGGAAGVIGAEIAALAPPDGYTLLFTSAALNMVAAMGTKTSYKVPDSFTPVANVIFAPMILVIHPSINVKTPRELIALAKSKPGQMVYASAGYGSPSHFITELFRARTGIDATGVQYRGSPQAMIDLMAGRVAFYFSPTSTALPQMQAGKVKGIAVGSEKRLTQAPEMPTMAEVGHKDIRASYWDGLLGPKGLPLPIANRVATAVNRVLARPDVVKSMEPLANELDGKSTPQSFAVLLKEDLETWTAVAKEANIKPN